MGRPERPGRVREVGFGITPLGRSATNKSQFVVTSSSDKGHQRMSELETSHNELREQLAQSREEVAKHREEVAQSEARHREELAKHREEQVQSEARHQAQMAEMMMTMRGMFEQLSQGMCDIGTSQVVNKCYLGKHYFLQCIVM